MTRDNFIEDDDNMQTLKQPAIIPSGSITKTLLN